jgi:hypothetical protein
MRAFLILLVIVGLGAAFFVQRRNEHSANPPTVPTSQQAAARQTSEHDWAKRSLETANSVARKIQQQRKDEDLSGAVGRR